MIRHFVKVSEPIEAVQWVNNNEDEIEQFLGQERVSFVPSIYNSSLKFILLMPTVRKWQKLATIL